MISQNDQPNLSGPDLVDLVANSLPSPESRAEFHRTMGHLKSLPQNDELLAILDMLLIITKITQDIPAQTLAVGQRINNDCREIAETIDIRKKHETECSQMISETFTELREKMTTKIISDIVTCISDNITQQFQISTIPLLVKELNNGATTINRANNGYIQAVNGFCNAWDSAANNTKKVIENINSASANATNCFEQTRRKMESMSDESVKFLDRAKDTLHSHVTESMALFKQSQKEFQNGFRKYFIWLLVVSNALILLLGIGIGAWLRQKVDKHLVPNNQVINEYQNLPYGNMQYNQNRRSPR